MSDMAPGGVRQSKRVKAGGPAAERTSGVSTRSGKRPQTSQEEVANQQLPQECVETPQSHEDVERPTSPFVDWSPEDNDQHDDQQSQPTDGGKFLCYQSIL